MWLGDPANQGRSDDRRLLERILTPSERLLVSVAPDPDAMLWSLWAGKEAAYKAWSRDQPRLIFSPRRYRIEFSPLEHQAFVHHEGRTLPLKWTRGPDWVHALAGQEADAVVEVESFTGDASQAVRALAVRAFLSASGQTATVRGQPPRFHQGMLPGPLVSLSHDGPYAAVAFRWPRQNS